MRYEFKNCEELLEICKKKKLSISQVAIKREMKLFKKNPPTSSG